MAGEDNESIARRLTWCSRWTTPGAFGP